MARRKFVASAVPTETIVTPAGVYSGILTTKVQSKNGSLVKVVPKTEWKDGEKVEFPGEFMLQGMILMEVILTSKKAIKALGKDEPYMNGFLRASFKLGEGEQEGISELVETPPLGQLLELLQLSDVDLEAEMDFEEDLDVEVPADMEDFPGAVQLLNDKAYYEALFAVICAYGVSLPVMVNLFDKASWGTNEGKPENGIDVTRDSLGIMPYIDGSEEDLV